MGLETGTYISDLVVTNPASNDPKSQGDDHLRLLKSTIKTTFPGVTGAVTPTHTELNYVDGVTSALQTQLDAKAPLASPALTGVPTVPTAASGTNTTQAASTAFVVATSLNANLPGQLTHGGNLITTDGTTASWTAVLDTSILTPAVGTAFATTTGTQTITNKILTSPVWADSTDTTKKANIVLTGVTAGQNRNITVEDKNILLKTPGWVYLSTVTASASATADLETTIDSTYDRYAIVLTGVQPSSDNVSLYVRNRVAGSYHSGSSDYIWSRVTMDTAVGITSDHAGQAFTPIAVNIGNDADRGLAGILYIDTPSSTAFNKISKWDLTHRTHTNVPMITTGIGIDVAGTGAVTGVRFLFSTGNIAAGTFTLFGIRKT